MKIITTMVLASILFVSAAVSATAESEDCGCRFTAQTPNGTQDLGGKSGSSSHSGLHKAAENSPAVSHSHSGSKSSG